MKIEDIQRVLIPGAGTMGQQIGFQCAMHAYDVMDSDSLFRRVGFAYLLYERDITSPPPL